MIYSICSFLNYNKYVKLAFHASDLAVHLYAADKARRKYEPEIAKCVEDVIALSKSHIGNNIEKVNKRLKGELRKIIAPALGDHDIKNVKFVIKKAGVLSSPYGSLGSLKNNGRAIIWISPSEYEHLEKSDNIAKEASYSLRHELGHILNGDYDVIGQRNEFIVEVVKRSVRVLPTLALSYSGYSYLSSLLVGYVIERVSADKISQWASNWLTRQKEYKADAFAAEHTPLEEADEAIKFFKDQREKNIALFDEAQRTFENGTFLTKIAARLILQVDAEGNERGDVEHPPLSERIALFENAMQEKRSRL